MENVSPFSGQHRADILRGIKAFMDTARERRARGLFGLLVALDHDPSGTAMQLDIVSGAVSQAEVADFGAGGLETLITRMDHAAFADERQHKQEEATCRH